MTAFGKFEEIQAWQKASELTKALYHQTASDEFRKDYGLRDQKGNRRIKHD